MPAFGTRLFEVLHAVSDVLKPTNLY